MLRFDEKGLKINEPQNTVSASGCCFSFRDTLYLIRGIDGKIKEMYSGYFIAPQKNEGSEVLEFRQVFDGERVYIEKDILKLQRKAKRLERQLKKFEVKKPKKRVKRRAR